jgi:hypothetical protein
VPAEFGRVRGNSVARRIVFCNIEIWQEVSLEVSSPPECPLACSQDGTGREVPCLRAGGFRRRTDGWLAGRMYSRYLASRGLIGCPGAPQPLVISLTSLIPSHFTRCTISRPPANSTSTFRNHCKMSETCIAPRKQVSLSFYIQR